MPKHNCIYKHMHHIWLECTDNAGVAQVGVKPYRNPT